MERSLWWRKERTEGEREVIGGKVWTLVSMSLSLFVNQSIELDSDKERVNEWNWLGFGQFSRRCFAFMERERERS